MSRNIKNIFKDILNFIFHVNVLFVAGYLVYYCITGTSRSIIALIENYHSYIHYGNETIVDFCLFKFTFTGERTLLLAVLLSMCTPFTGLFFTIASIGSLLKMVRYYFSIKLAPTYLIRLSEAYNIQTFTLVTISFLVMIATTLLTFASMVFFVMYLLFFSRVAPHIYRTDVQDFLAQFSLTQAISPLLQLILMAAYFWLVTHAIHFILKVRLHEKTNRIRYIS